MHSSSVVHPCGFFLSYQGQLLEHGSGILGSLSLIHDTWFSVSYMLGFSVYYMQFWGIKQTSPYLPGASR